MLKKNKSWFLKDCWTHWNNVLKTQRPGVRWQFQAQEKGSIKIAHLTSRWLQPQHDVHSEYVWKARTDCRDQNGQIVLDSSLVMMQQFGCDIGRRFPGFLNYWQQWLFMKMWRFSKTQDLSWTDQLGDVIVIMEKIDWIHWWHLHLLWNTYCCPWGNTTPWRSGNCAFSMICDTSTFSRVKKWRAPNHPPFSVKIVCFVSSCGICALDDH